MGGYAALWVGGKVWRVGMWLTCDLGACLLEGGREGRVLRQVTVTHRAAGIAHRVLEVPGTRGRGREKTDNGRVR